MTSRERMPEPSNPLGMDGIEFIEYATSQPQAFGDLLQRMGFVPLARHRSREVLLYRQGPMNLIVNSHGATTAMPTVSAVALRVRWSASGTKPMRCSRSPKACGWLVAYSMNSMPVHSQRIGRLGHALSARHTDSILMLAFCQRKEEA